MPDEIKEICAQPGEAVGLRARLALQDEEVRRARTSERLLRATVDSLTDNIAVLDGNGTILAVNRVWRTFAQENGGDPDAVSEGANYLSVTDAATGKHSEEAGFFASGIRAVYRGEMETFSLEYPCDSPNERRWFIGHVTRLHGMEPPGIVVAHQNITAQKRSETAPPLQNLIVDVMAEGVCLVRVSDETIVYANPRFESMFGYGPGELAGLPVAIVNYDTDQKTAEKVAADIVAKLKREGEATYEVQNVRKDGTPFWCRAHTVPLEHPEWGEVWVAVHTDITERKRSEEALRVDRERLHGVLEGLPMMVCLLTPDHHVSFANRAFREKFGESQGRRCYEYCFGLEAPCDFCETYKVLETGKPHRWSTSCMDGVTLLEVYDFPFHDVDGSPMILEVDIDITEQRRAQEALQESERFLRSTLDALSGNVAVLDEEGGILFVNGAWRRFAEQNGHSPDAVWEGINYLHVCDTASGQHAEEADLFAAGIRNVLAGQEDAFTLDYPCHSPGAERWFTGRVTPIRGASPPRAVVMHEDITPRKQAEAAVARYTEQLGLLALALSETEDHERRRVSDYVHDHLGQALTAVRLKFNAWKRMERSSGSDALLAEIERMIDRTLEETRTLTFDLSPPILFSLGLGSAIEWLGEHLIEPEHIDFEFHDDGRCPALEETHASAMYRLVRELLLNVVKHAHAKRVSVSLRFKKGMLCLEVADDGAGMEQARCQHALQGATGTYGLFSLRERLRHLNGSIEVDTSVGAGTRVMIRLPVPPREEDNAQ